MAPPPRNRIDSDTPGPPHDSRQRPASQSEPEGPQRSLCEPTRGTTVLHLTPANGNKPHTTVRISTSRPRETPALMSESKDIARTTCEQTAAESGQMCRQNESSAMSHACSVGEYMAPRAPEIHVWDGMEGGRQC